MSDLMVEAPRLAPSVAEVLQREQAVAERINALSQLLADFTRPVDVDEVREELAHITRETSEHGRLTSSTRPNLWISVSVIESSLRMMTRSEPN